MKKFILISVGLVVFAITTSSAQGGYIATDTSTYQGQIIDQGIFRNNREVKFSKSKISLPTTYYPKDLSEFGFEDKVYISKIVTDGNSKTPYFLLRLLNGPLKLYLLKTRKGDRLFGEGNEDIIELAKDSYKEDLLNIVKDHSLDNSFTLLKYSKKSLKRFFFLHNRSFKGLFPALRKGFLFGLSSSVVSVNGFEGETISIGNDLAPIFGVFIDFPLGLKPKWFMNAQVYYQENSYSRFVKEEDRNLDFLINTSTLNIPMLIKYRSTSLKFRSFITAGPALTYYLKNENELFETTNTGQVIEINRVQLNSISTHQINGVFGIGTEYSLNLKKSISLELRLSKGVGLGGTNRQSTSVAQVFTSIYF